VLESDVSGLPTERHDESVTNGGQVIQWTAIRYHLQIPESSLDGGCANEVPSARGPLHAGRGLR
jgi:hypothetical protein